MRALRHLAQLVVEPIRRELYLLGNRQPGMAAVLLHDQLRRSPRGLQGFHELLGLLQRRGKKTAAASITELWCEAVLTEAAFLLKREGGKTDPLLGCCSAVCCGWDSSQCTMPNLECRE